MLKQHQDTIDQLLAEHEIPVLTGPQRQGDVLIWPTDTAPRDMPRIPAEGIPAVQGQHTHLLTGAGCFARATNGDPLHIGGLTVDPDGIVWMLHEEHGGNAIGPGTYVLRGKREQAEIERRVAD